jgi:nucleoside-diphosphate-sugar epimerase
MKVAHPLAEDLDGILARLGGTLEALRGKRIFITGGTGFFGSWMVETLAWANRSMDLGVSALLLSRDPSSFLSRMPGIAEDPAFSFHVGDVRHFEFPEGRFPFVIHAATTSAPATFANEEPLAKFDTLALGTRRVLDFSIQCGVEQMLFTSSGCAYGPQPPSMRRLTEDFPGAPDPMNPCQALGHGKRAAEFLCAAYAEKHGFEAKIARGFCFVGPHLQMDIQYAIGNFILDVLNGKPIRVRGDGSQFRSYMYAADLMVWFWTILLKGKSCRPYNMGSEHDLSIGELATRVAETLDPGHRVEIARSPSLDCPAERYVPCTSRAQEELGLREFTSLEDAILKTAAFHRIFQNA